jgi:two-component system, OmpR family, response regulator VanR
MNTKKKLIVIVEDIGALGVVLKSRLNDDGYETKIFESGVAALEFMNKNRFDILITDINMPELNGIQLIRKVRESIDMDVPIILISGIDDDAFTSYIFEVGATDFVLRPVKISELYLRAKRFLIKDNSSFF